MKIVHIVCRYPPYYGGMGNTTFQLVQELSERGHDVHVITPQYSEPTPQDIDHVTRVAPHISYGNAAILPSIDDELAQADIVHLHYPFFGVANKIRKWKQRYPSKKLVVTYHMDNRANGLIGLYFKSYAKWWLPKILAVADACIGSSFDYIQASDATTHFATHQEKWHEVPFGVNQTRFEPGDRSNALIRSYGLQETLPIVGFVGGMDSAHYFKGVKELLQAIAELKHHNHVFVQALLVGDGNLRSQYEQLAEQLGIKELVAFAGFVADEDLADHYRAFDLFALPSTSVGEAFGTVLLEAMACGVPVVASDLAGVRTVAMHAGWVVPPRSSHHIAQAIELFLSRSPKEKQFFSQKARAAVETHYSWKKVVDRLEGVYEGVVKKEVSP